ncbi:MAG: glycosyl hydrolase family 28 protein [Rikenellaceae bacterium]
MKRLSAIVALVCCFVLTSCVQDNSNRFRIYDAPQGIELSKAYTLEVEGCNVPLYKVIIPDSIPVPRLVPNRKSGVASMALFDVNDKVAVSVASDEIIESVKILPTSYNIPFEVVDNKVLFSIDGPMHLTVEINGNWHESLHISANPFETDVPDPDDENVIYFGAGLHDITSVVVEDNQTLYIAPGAYIRCTMEQEDQMIHLGDRDMVMPSILVKGKNVTVRGRGIIDGGAIPRARRRNLLLVHDSENVSIEGICFFDSSSWTLPIKCSDNVHVDNIKLTGWRGNADGIDISNSRDVVVENSFLRTFDDLVVVKSFGGLGEVYNIHVRKCVLWNELAHSLSIGAEVHENVTNVLFEDCDVIHDVGRATALRVYHCDSAVISDVTFQNIRVEEGRRLISVWIGSTRWSKTEERGHIRNVVFRDITTTSAPIDPTIKGFQDATDWNPYIIKDHASVEVIGYDEQHLVENVTFENVIIDGKKFDESRTIFVNEFALNIQFK